LQGVQPTGSMVLLSFFNVLLSGVFAWFTYAFLANLLGPRLGGSAKKGVLWGAMALASTPQVLRVANLIPGMTVPPTLVSIWTLACVYQAAADLIEIQPPLGNRPGRIIRLVGRRLGVPLSLLGSWMGIGLAVWLWSLVIAVNALTAAHELTSGKAARVLSTTFFIFLMAIPEVVVMLLVMVEVILWKFAFP
jgi:hypothetical protein